MGKFGGSVKSAGKPTPTTWFAVLCAARASGDRALEELARRELDRDGYVVTVKERNRDRRHAPGI